MPPITFDNLSPTLATVPNDMGPYIPIEINNPCYALPYVRYLFTIEISSRIAQRKPTVQYIIWQTVPNLHPGLDLGFQKYHKESPVPLPSLTNSGLFDHLFGILFYS
jgi:hypothetical protein